MYKQTDPIAASIEQAHEPTGWLIERWSGSSAWCLAYVEHVHVLSWIVLLDMATCVTRYSEHVVDGADDNPPIVSLWVLSCLSAPVAVAPSHLIARYLVTPSMTTCSTFPCLIRLWMALIVTASS